MPGDIAVTPTSEDAVYKEEEKLRDLDYYHGFFPREDLPFLIHHEGDYLLRISEVDASTGAAQSKIKRDVILSFIAECDQESVMVSPDLQEATSMMKKSKLRNVVVRRVGNKYMVEAEKVFDSIKELMGYYEHNFGTLNKSKFKLRNGVTRARWELLHTDIVMGSLLGEGAFGEVRKGVWTKKGKARDVAVKVTKGVDDLCKEKIKEMMREARLMRNLSHRNIVRLYGVAVDEQPLYIVLELVKGGALNSYLEKKKGQVELKEKLGMCLGAALGVEYLHKKDLIHRDLAARNCLYTESKVVKISDFGLSRKGKEYQIRSKVKLPIKWLAPETITKFVFTDKTDVYSYGVMGHEIYADGTEPWEGISNTEVKKAVVEGKMLPMKEAPERIRVFCQERVLIKEGRSRAAMSEVVAFLDQLNKEGKNVASDVASDHKDTSDTAQKSVYEGSDDKRSVYDTGKNGLQKSIMNKSVTVEVKSQDKKTRSRPTKSPMLSKEKVEGMVVRKRKSGFHNRKN